MITEQRCSDSHIQFFDSEAPKDKNCIATVRTEYAQAFRAALEMAANPKDSQLQSSNSRESK